MLMQSNQQGRKGKGQRGSLVGGCGHGLAVWPGSFGDLGVCQQRLLKLLSGSEYAGLFPGARCTG